MILLVPLNRYRVEYEVGVGQPYSDLHKLILRVVEETGGASIEMLQGLFGLPSRLLIEILISLFKEGWIAISLKTGGGFDITPRGREALRSNKPPQIRRVEPRSGSVLMERLTGTLIPQREISGSYESKRTLENNGVWRDAYVIPAEFNENAVDEGQMQGLLRRDKREYIRHIKPPELTGKGWYYLPVDVNPDPERMQVLGVPERWRAHLEPLLLDIAAERAKKQPSLLDKNYWAGAAPVHDRDETTATGMQTTIRPDDLLLTNERHARQLESALAEAKSVVLIASASLDVGYVSRVLRGQIVEAVGRGVHVSLLWGEEVAAAGRGGSLVGWLEGGAGELRAAAAKGLLSANAAPTNSHASLLIYDTEEGFRACVGGYGWLSPAADDSRHATVVLSHPSIVAEFCRSVAALSATGSGNQASSSPDRWRRIAEDLDEKAAVPEAEPAAVAADPHDCFVQVVRDQEHLALLSECLLSAQERCAVLSRWLGAAAERRLSPLKRRGGSPLALAAFYGEARNLKAEEVAALETLVREGGGELRRHGELMANAVVADTTVVLGSHPFLFGNAFERRSQAHEVGVLIDGGVVADELWAAFCGPR
jgi:hypothetical protein